MCVILPTNFKTSKTFAIFLLLLLPTSIIVQNAFVMFSCATSMLSHMCSHGRFPPSCLHRCVASCLGQRYQQAQRSAFRLLPRPLDGEEGEQEKKKSGLRV